jgi:protein SCO1/2
MFNRTTVYILIAAVAAALGLVVAQRHFATPEPAPMPSTQAVRLFDPPRQLPPFALRQADGTALEPADLQGHWTLVFLGFTHCPDVCPMTLSRLSQAQQQWEALPEATRPRVLFLSVDPERDTLERIGKYAHAFHPDTLAATAEIPALEDFTRSLSLVFAKVPAPEGVPADQYSVDHSASMAVLDPQGRMAGVVQQPFEPAVVAADLAALTRAGAP